MYRKPDVDALDLTVWKTHRSKFFTPGELRSKGNGDLLIHEDSFRALNVLRQTWGRAIYLHSAYRDPNHNANVGGAKNSLHMQGRAFDVDTLRWSDAWVVSFIHHATLAGFRGFGLYLDQRVPFIHIDTGAHRTWQVGQSQLDDTDDTNEIL